MRARLESRCWRWALVLALMPAPLWAVEPREAGLNELVVYDPGAHERGLPAVVLNPAGPDSVRVDIPETLHVHRFYYSGDKEYQGPIIEGGPTVVVAKHPKLGEMMYVPVNLPSGAPRIAYSDDCITYIFNDRRVQVRFKCWGSERAVVSYCSGVGWSRAWHDACDERVERIQERAGNSRFGQAAKQAASGTGQLVLGVGSAAGNAASGALEKAGAWAKSFPGITTLQSLAKQRPVRQRDNAIDASALRIDRDDAEFVTTIR